MWIRRLVLVIVAAIGATGTLLAQQAAEPTLPPPPPEAAAEQPCVVDEQLSLWLSLEAADRMIARLERERRDLASELSNTLKALDVLARADEPEGVGLAELNTLVTAKALGQAAISDAYNDLQNRLVEIDKTLKRRYEQQSALEARIEALSR